jgi:stage III sporulation protein AG
MKPDFIQVSSGEENIVAQQNAIKHIIGKIRNIKTTEIFVGLLVVAVILSLYTSSFGKTSYTEGGRDEENRKGIQWVNHETNRDQLEEKLQEKLSSIKGAGKVEVMITYKSSKEIIPAVNTTESQTTTEEQDTSGGVRTDQRSNCNC